MIDLADMPTRDRASLICDVLATGDAEATDRLAEALAAMGDEGFLSTYDALACSRLSDAPALERAVLELQDAVCQLLPGPLRPPEGLTP